MKWKLLFLVTSFCSLLAFRLQAQQADKVIFRNEILRADQEAGMLKITFRLDVPEDEFFDISELEVHTDGRVIHSKALSGDTQDIGAGEHVIYWDVFKDVDQLESISDMKIKLLYTDLTHNRMKTKSVEDELMRRREEIRQDAAAARERETRKQKESVVEMEKIAEPEKEQPKKKKGWNRSYGHLRIGLKSGVNILTPHIKSKGLSNGDYDLDINYTPGWNIGAVARLHLTKFWGISAEMHYGSAHMNLKFDGHSLEHYSDYTEELKIEHDKLMKFSFTKYPVYVTTHLNENLTLMFGKYWTNYSKANIQGEFRREWKTYDDRGDYQSGGDYRKEIDLSLFQDELEQGQGLPFTDEDDGWIMGLEVDSKKASFGVYYEWSTYNAFNDDYFNTNYSIWHQNINMKTDVLPDAESTKMYMQQLSLQLTIWL